MNIRLSDFRADLVGKEVTINAQIAGEQGQKALSEHIQWECQYCSSLIPTEYRQPEKQIFEKPEKPYICESCEKKGPFKNHSGRYTDYSILFLRDILDLNSKFDSREYTNRKIYLVGKIAPSAKKVTVKGEVVVEPKTQDITLIAKEIEPFESEITNFKLTEEDKESFENQFRNGIDLKDQVAPGVVGRDIVKQTILLLLHSPNYIPDINGDKNIRGSLRAIFFGDTDTAKSMAAKDITNDPIEGHYPFGEYIAAESAARTGVAYTIDSDSKTLIWGVLPMNDLGLVVLDGLHSFSYSELQQLREALTNQRVQVTKMLKGEAWARNRVIGIFNPKKPMNHYVYPCMAILDSKFSNAPDITRWDIWLPFGSRDVESSDLANREPVERPIPDEIFTRHVYWVWSRKPEDIEYLPEAMEAIIKATKEFIAKYLMESLPLVSNAFRDNITRLAVAYAALTHSTDSTQEKMIVKWEHVESAKEFIELVFSYLELENFKLDEEGKHQLTRTEFEEISKELKEPDYEILEALKVEPSTAANLAGTLDMGERTVKEHFKLLKKFNLIKTTPGVGTMLTPRGVQFFRLFNDFENNIEQELSAKVQKSCTNEAKNAENEEKVQENCTNALSLHTNKNSFLESIFGDDSDITREKWHKAKIVISENLSSNRINPETFQRELSRVDISIPEQEEIIKALNIKEVGKWYEVPKEGLEIMGVR